MTTEADLDLVEEAAARQARRSFWAYRQYVNPGMLRGWFQRDVARRLQLFHDRWRQGLRPKLLLMAPPQHGKSRQVVDFITWVQGHHPTNQTIYGSFSDRLGIRANLRIQRVCDSRPFQVAFPSCSLPPRMTPTAIRNRDQLEFLSDGVPAGGSFRNTTVRGPVTGEGLNLGVVDDPIKGRMEANSETVRDNAWEWLTDDFMTRFSDDGALLMILTRWHMDDPAGRLIEELGGDVEVIRYPALAEQDEAHRRQGEPLFPELKSMEFLAQRRAVMTQGSWESLYQQNPIIVGGGIFPIDLVPVRSLPPSPFEVLKSVRYWDKAGTEGDGAYTAGVLMHFLKSGRTCVGDVQRGQWGSRERERRIRQTAEIDNKGRHRVKTYVEQEPGSGGKESAENTILNLRGFSVEADRVTGDKEVRAEPFAAQVQGGNVDVVAADWNRAYLSELEQFPSGKFKDQVDASSGAFNKLALGSQYTLENVA